jgi:selenocysteine-specific elongation factor
VKPGEHTYARIVLREPALLLPGDRFIIRMFSPVVTIGGGVVLDGSGIRYRKTDHAARRLDILAGPDIAAKIALLVRESKFGLSFGELVSRTGLQERDLEAAARSFILLRQPQSWLIGRDWFEKATQQITSVVRAFHTANPLLPGIARQDLRGRELADAPTFVFDTILAGAKDLAVEGEIVRSRSHKVVFKQDEEQARATIEHAFEQAGLAAPTVSEVLAKSGVEAARARSLLQILIREKRLVRINADLVFHHSALESLRGLLAGRKSARFSVGAFKDWTGISRKYAIPLLEYLDREHITRREGDERLVL